MGSWIPTPKACRRWRDFHKLTVPKLCDRTRVRGKKQVSERTVRKLESKDPQEYLQDGIIRALAKAFTFDGVVCHPEFLGTWKNDDGTFAAPKRDEVLIDPTLHPSARLAEPAPPTPVPATRPFAAARSDDEPSALEIQKRLTANAEIERAISQHALTIEVDGSVYPVVGIDWLKELQTSYAEHEGRTFAVAGQVLDTRAIPTRAATILKADLGRGAACVKIGRIARGKDRDGTSHQLEVYPTVFAAKGEQGKQLTAAHKEKRVVTVLVKLVIAEPTTGAARDERWEGFIWFESGRARPKPYALVSESVLVGDILLRALRVGEKRAPILAPGGIPVE